MSVTDDLLRANRAYAEGFDKQGLQKSPRRRLAVVACMDSRIDLFAALGLAVGDAHVIRNAGGVVTDDVVRSLVISQRLLGTEEVVLVHHTDCGMVTFTDDELADRIHDETGVRPPFAFQAFADLDGDVRESIRRLRSSPFLAHIEHIRGFVYDVESGRLREVSATA